MHGLSMFHGYVSLQACMMCYMSCMQAIKVLNMIKLFGKAIRVNKASQDKDTLDVGANLFIGNLDPDVDEKVLPACLCRSELSCTTSSAV